jgi:hypothetical protein
MTKMCKNILSSACLIILIFCATVSYAQDVSDGEFISYPNRTVEEWKPENAIKEAEYDIKNNKIKIYYSGTITAGPVGVSPEEAHLIKNLPIADGGIGCKITNSELRNNQAAYAKKYNKIIILHLKWSYQ